jgi:uncharacterized protein YcfJ
MLKRITLTLAAAIFALSAGITAANADGCSGHRHNTGTVVGAVGGGLIGNAITHGSAVGVIGGAVAGGLAGNAVARGSDDCRGERRHRQAYYYDSHHHKHYYANNDR